MSDRIAVLRNGKLVATVPAARGRPRDARRSSWSAATCRAPVAKPHAPGDVVCEIDERHASSGAARRRDARRCARARSPRSPACRATASRRSPTCCSACARRMPGACASPAARSRRDAARVGRRGRRAHSRGPAGVGSIGAAAAVGKRDRRALPHAVRAAAGVVRRARRARYARDVIARFDVRAGGGIDTPARSLSGGNMQKLILGRALATDLRATGAPPVLIVADQPTWGLDIGAVAFVHQQLLDACARGARGAADLRRPGRDLRARRPHRGDSCGTT